MADHIPEERSARTALDLKLTLAWHRAGRMDPTSAWVEGRFVKAFDSPDGPVTVALGLGAVEAWGPGRAWVTERAAGLVRPTDPELSAVPHQRVRDLHLRFSGLRVVRVPWIEDLLVLTILQQRVRYADAAFAYRQLAELRGEAAPGPFSLLLPARPFLHADLGRLGKFGVDGKRSRALLAIAPLSRRLCAAFDTSPERLRSLLDALPGVGPWTRESVMALGYGDADALPLGDLHYPHNVSEALTGQRWSDDNAMQELLEPYRGLRFRVLRLLLQGAR